MFETLFSYPAVLQRHRAGPLADERDAYLEGLAAQGSPRSTLLKCARYCLCVAHSIDQFPPTHRVDEDELEKLASAWADKRTAEGHASGPRWPKVSFRLVARGFLRSIGRLRLGLSVAPGRYDREVDEFVASQREDRWTSEATCRTGRWQVARFLRYLEDQGLALGDARACHLDTYFQHMAQRWGRVSLRSSATILRSWFAYCEMRGWAAPRLAQAILLPRIYRDEGLPLGPTWDEVGGSLASTAGDEPAQLRDHALLRLLSVYGVRSGEVRRLGLEDLHWEREQIRIVRSKSSREELLPLEPSVGNAIARYLRQGRPKSPSRIVFLTLRVPYRPLSASGLYDVVKRHLYGRRSCGKGHGPHGLRHACARHLLESGRSFKEVGDHLGHRSPDATRIYAKVDLVSLRRVALDDLRGLV